MLNVNEFVTTAHVIIDQAYNAIHFTYNGLSYIFVEKSV